MKFWLQSCFYFNALIIHFKMPVWEIRLRNKQTGWMISIGSACCYLQLNYLQLQNHHYYILLVTSGFGGITFLDTLILDAKKWFFYLLSSGSILTLVLVNICMMWEKVIRRFELEHYSEHPGWHIIVSSPPERLWKWVLWFGWKEGQMAA